MGGVGGGADGHSMLSGACHGARKWFKLLILTMSLNNQIRVLLVGRLPPQPVRGLGFEARQGEDLVPLEDDCIFPGCGRMSEGVMAVSLELSVLHVHQVAPCDARELDLK